MTSTAAPAPGSGGARQDVSGAVTSVLVRYVRQCAGEDGIARMLAAAGERRGTAAVEDAAGWSTHDEAVRLFHAAAAVVGDPAVGRRVGEEMLRQHDGTNVASLLRSLGSPGELLRNVAAALAKFSTVTAVETLELGDSHAVVRATTRAGFRRERCLCDVTAGLLSQVPVLFGLEPAEVVEPECQADGGHCCLYSVSWGQHRRSAPTHERTGVAAGAWHHDAAGSPARAEPHDRPPAQPDDRARAEDLRRQVAQLTGQLQAVYSSAADLLAADDIDTVLSRITERAAHAVDAPRYLLVVRTSPGEPPRLHHHGFNDAEAAALAGELLGDDPDDRDGSRLIVDITSRRRAYGRLAAVFPDGVRFFAEERRTLALYADYAAAALDVVASLDEVRRSDATARALLDFSRALARATTSDDVARTLAAAVPAATGAQRSAVWLWDAADGCLRRRAHWAAPASPVGPPMTPLLDAPVPLERQAAVRLVHGPGVVVVRRTDTDPQFAALFDGTGARSAAIAPLVSGGELLGLVTAEIGAGAPADRADDGDLQERLGGLAGQAVTAIINTRLLEQVSHMAWHDDLTGLPNRRLLEDRVNQELLRARRTGEPLCMFFVDLDRFKHVNDTLGHAAGDELIVEVARRLCQTVRSQDTVARLGGDEFAVLLPNLGDAEVVQQLAHRAIEALRAPYRIAGRELYASASIGVAVAPEHGDSYDQLLTASDAAMYRSKSLGRDTFQVFHPGDGAGPQPDERLVADLAHAADRGELFLVYQPYVDLATGDVIGVEALARWDHPERGVLEPGAFVPLAEDTELIVAVDSWVVAEACRQVGAWGLPGLRLSVNVSTRDLAGDAFVGAVARALVDTGFPPERLELEVTERVVLDLAGAVEHGVERLRRLGVRFSVDDFGSGQSALGRLAAFPVSTLKIHQSFVQVLGPFDESAALVSGIVSMARELGVDVVAEGVETLHQHRILAQRGCSAAQGFFFSPPLRPDDVRRLFAEQGLHQAPVPPGAGAPSAPPPGAGATV